VGFSPPNGFALPRKSPRTRSRPAQSGRIPSGITPRQTSDLLGAYCLLVEERYGKPVRRGRLQYPNGSLNVAFDAALRTALLLSLREIQQRRTAPDVGRSHRSPARRRGCGFRERCAESLA
jgi:CRISPR/Cas system-associated exonuclease Cas4 (RecB family)